LLLLLLFGEIIPLLKIDTDWFNVILSSLFFCEVNTLLLLFVIRNCVSGVSVNFALRLVVLLFKESNTLFITLEESLNLDNLVINDSWIKVTVWGSFNSLTHCIGSPPTLTVKFLGKNSTDLVPLENSLPVNTFDTIVNHRNDFHEQFQC
jgi:hypothetical protein